MFGKAFKRFAENRSLIIYPVLWNLLILFSGYFFYGLHHGEAKFAPAFVLEIGLPDFSTILQQQSVNNIWIGETSVASGNLHTTLSLFVLFLLAGSFLQAGFISLLYRTIVDKPISYAIFLEYGMRFWLRMLMVALVTLLLSVGMLFFTIVFGGLGAFLALIGFFVLRIMFIFWEFTIVAEDLGLWTALSRCRVLFANRIPGVAWIIVAMFTVNLMFAVVINGFWNPLMAIMGIGAYTYVAIGMQLALMDSFVQVLHSQAG